MIQHTVAICGAVDKLSASSLRLWCISPLSEYNTNLRS